MTILKRYVLIAIAILALIVAFVWAIDNKRAEIAGAWWRFRYHRLRPLWLDIRHAWRVVELAVVWMVASWSGLLLWLLGGKQWQS